MMKFPFLRFFLFLLLICGCFCDNPAVVIAAEGVALEDVPFIDGDPSAPQSYEGKATYELVDCTEVEDIPESECEALLDFYVSTNGEDWIYLAAHIKPGVFYWFETENAGDWEGVTVTAGTVTSIVLDNHNLSGFIPDSISDLPNLLEICLLSNAVGGELPDSLGSLAFLEKLSLSHNAFEGEIPVTFGNLASLKKLSIGGNHLAGGIPEELGKLTLLERLDVNSNHMSGELPESLGQLSLLTDLILFKNGFTGLVPSSYVNLESLYYFYFFATDLCEHTDPDFLAWKATVTEWQGTGCVCRIFFPLIYK